MKLKLELYRADELEAFGAFMKRMADIQKDQEDATAQFYAPKTDMKQAEPKDDPIMDENGGQIGTASPVVEDRKTFMVPDGSAAVRDGEGRATGALRKRGEPSPGKARRTKAEIAEDNLAEEREDFDKMDPDTQTLVVETQKGLAAISTGEERVGPEDSPEDSPEDAAQDAADEASETASAATDGPTTEELRAAVNAYTKTHGMGAAVALVKPGGLIGTTIDQVPASEIAAVIEKLRGAPLIEGAAIGGAAAKPAEPVATKEMLMEAMMRYADKFDGTREMAGMKHTQADGPTIFKMLFGEAVTKFSQVPADGYGRAIAAFDEAIVKNPFSR